MSEPTVSTVGAPAVAPKASFWEDLIDVFITPADVFRRRQNASPWPIFFFVVVAVTVIAYFTFPAIQPALDGEFSRNLPKMQAQNPNLTPEMAQKIQNGIDTWARYSAGLAGGANILINALLVWLVSKFFSASEGFGAAMLISGYAYLPRVLGSVISGAMALVMDPTKLTSMSMLTLSPARFLDPDTTSPFTMALLSRLDVMILWETVLLAIGIRIIGKVSRGNAVAFGVVIWIVGGLYALRNAYLIS
jgi:hypothetical protein